MAKGENKTNNDKKAKAKTSVQLGFDAIEKEENMSVPVKKPAAKEKKAILSNKKGKLPLEADSRISSVGNEKLFDPASPIFLQLHAGNIYQIFSAAILSLNPGPFNDVQRQSGAGLVLSNGYFEKLDENVVLLEIKLRKNELTTLLISGSNAYYQKPMPVTRIQKIWVSSENVKKDILTNTLSGDSGIIPDKLIVSHFPDGLNKHTLATDQIYLAEFTDQLDRFDKILGTFSFLRNYSVLLSNRTQSIDTYPDHFFAAAQTINQNEILGSRHEKQAQFYRQLFSISNTIEHPLMGWLINRVKSGRNFTDEDTRNFGVLLFNNSSSIKFKEESRHFLELLAKNIDRRNILLDIAQMDEPDKFYIYLFAALRLYGNLNTESRSISRIDLQDVVSPSYGGFVFALLGHFFGYEKLRNYEERVNIKDPILMEAINAPRRWTLKFELKTLLDYVIIESIFELAFNGNKNYAEIDNWLFPDFLISESLPILKEVPGYEIKQTILLGKRIVTAKKKQPAVVDELAEVLKKVPEEIPLLSTLGIYCLRKGVKCYTEGMAANGTAVPLLMFYFKKEDVVAFFKAGKEATKEELINRVNISLQLNDFS